MKTNIILEMCYNHQGDVETAKKMIDEAFQLRVWAVKFQKWDIDSFPEEIKEQPRNDKHAFGDTYYEHREKLELSISELLMLKEYANKYGLLFICSAKDLKSLIQLTEAGIKIIKLPSQRLIDGDMYRFLKNNRPDTLIISTGMHYEDEIKKSKILNIADIVMHCVTDYPANLNDCDIAYMRNSGIYNGYSSHEFEGRAIKYAVCAGASYIERHYTLDKTMKGADHISSSDYEEIKRIINEIKEAEMVMGSGKREMNKPELVNRKYYLNF